MRMTSFAAGMSLALGLLAGSAQLALSQESIKIGGIFALTGPAAQLGTAANEGVRYAIDDANKAGGLVVNGKTYKLEYIGYDDQFKSTEAVSAYGRLVDRDEVKYLFTMFSASHMAIKGRAETENVFVLTSAIAEKAIEPTTKNMVRIQTLVKDYLPGMTKALKDTVKGDKVAILYPQDESGNYFASLSVPLFEKAGMKIVAKELVERTAKDFQPVLVKIIATNPDVIELGPQVSTTAGLIIRQARELGYKNAFALLGGSGIAGILEAAGPQASEGLLHMVFADPENAGFKSIAGRYKEKIGQQPNELIVNFYDGASALLKAIQVSGDPKDPVKVRNAFATIFPFKSAQGDMITYGGKESIGIDAQMFSKNYIAVLKNGVSVVLGVAN